ncbi:MAG: hypothetical protein K1W34_19030 [Lachnospiraceae bacterium]
MQKSDEEFKRRVFDLMNGSLNLEQYPVEESKYVKNEFSLGGFCDEAYQRVYNANRRLCERLGVEEDKDVESIITDLLDIGEYLALKMFDYGCFFSASSV